MRTLVLIFSLFIGLGCLSSFALAGVGSLAARCNLFDSNGVPSEACILKHGPFVLGMSSPGWLHHLNSTVMRNAIPGYTTYEDIPESVYSTYQANGFTFTDSGCAWTNHRYEGGRGHRVYGYGKWLNHINADQTASPPFPGAGRQDLMSMYRVQAVEPILFDQLGITMIEVTSMQQSSHSYYVAYNLVLPGGIKIPLFDETIVVSAETLQNMAEGDFFGKIFYYSLNFMQVRFPNWGYINRVEEECDGATGYLADACECHQRMLNGQLTLENDPIAEAAGQYHEILLCRLEDPVEAQKRTRTVEDNIAWPQNALSRASYKLALEGKFSYGDQPLKYVRGMPATKAQHDAVFFPENPEADQ